MIEVLYTGAAILGILNAYLRIRVVNKLRTRIPSLPYVRYELVSKLYAQQMGLYAGLFGDDLGPGGIVAVFCSV